jgi:ArsR family transcriptional regulator, lead/cadmium/zinc/bismuth-responsive transcriptional repressor
MSGWVMAGSKEITLDLRTARGSARSDGPAVAPRHDPADAPQVGTISPREAERLAALFRLLGDASRTRILYALLEAGELCVGDIASGIGAADAKVSQALRLLRTAGVVRSRRDGRHVLYRLDDDHVRSLLELSREHLHHLDASSPESHRG